MYNKFLGGRNFEKDAERLLTELGDAPDAFATPFGKILVIHKDDGGVEVFAVSSAGFDLALAAADNGDAVWLPPFTSIGDAHTVPVGVGVQAYGKKSNLTGPITLSNSSFLNGVYILNTASSASELVGVQGPSTGLAYLNDCSIIITNSGVGDATGLQVNAGNLWAWNCRIEGLTTGGGDGYAVKHGTGICFLEGGYVVGTTDEFDIVTAGSDWSAGAEISTGSISVGAPNGINGSTISGLTIGNTYSVEAYNGPWDRGFFFDPEYDYKLSNDSGATWSSGFLGRLYDGVMYLDYPGWVAYAEVVATDYARCYFIATTTSIKIRNGETGTWSDNSGTLSWRLRSATFTPGDSPIQVHAVRSGEDGQPLIGDRSAWDVLNYDGLHANDIAQSTLKRHLPYPTLEGSIAVVSEVDSQLVWVESSAAGGSTGAIFNAILTDDNYAVLVDDNGNVLSDDQS